MTACQNCGKLNSEETNFCRFCGTKFVYQQHQVPHNPYGQSSPRPYAWKTDEFQTQNEPRPTERVDAPTQPFNPNNPNYQPAPLAYHQASPLHGPYVCPRCGNRSAPRYERQISTSGWIVFAVLLVVFFPLFWIGFLMKEDVQVCSVCNSKTPLPQQLYR